MRLPRVAVMPDALFTRAVMMRAAVLWLGLRLAIACSGLLAGILLLPVGVAVSLIIVAATVFLAAIELRRRDEFLLLGNLGHSPVVLLALSALPAVPLEIVFTAVVR